MNFLVVGLGSMGKRRIRCLKALGEESVYGFDKRPDRREEAEEKYGIRTFDDFETAVATAKPNALVVSVPPDAHHIYMKFAIERGIHFFVEASVTDDSFDWIKAELKKGKVVGVPSSTLMFHPAIRMIDDFVKSGELGKVSNLLFHSGQYLPDWHTYEKVSEYYVSNPLTGGGREIVPFELTWITKVFGFPKKVAGNFRKTINIEGAEKIEDTYNILMDYGDRLACVTVDVVSRYATRRLMVNGDKAQLVWSWDQNCIQVYYPEKAQWVRHEYKMMSSEKGYNPNIGENMYIEEIRNFLDAIAGKAPAMNTMEDDHKVLKILYAAERSDKSGHYEDFSH